MGDRLQALMAQVHEVFLEEELLSIRSSERYQAAAADLVRFLAAKTDLHYLKNLMPYHIRAYAEHLRSRGASTNTIRTALSAAQFLHDYYVLTGEARFDGPMPTPVELGLRTGKRAGTRAWKRHQVESLIESLYRAAETRAADLCALGWELGLRIEEPLKLTRGDVEDRAVEDGTIRIRGKGRKERLVPLTEVAREILERRRRMTPRGGRLFVAPDETAGQVKQQLQRLVARYRPAPEPDQSGPLSFHGLRYAYAQRMVLHLRQQGIPFHLRRYAVSILLGHGRETITDLYALPAVHRGRPDERDRPDDTTRRVLRIIRRHDGGEL